MFVCPVTAAVILVYRENNGRCNRAPKEVFRHQSNQSEDLVCADHPFTTRRGGLAARATMLDWNPAPNSAIPGCRGASHVPCVFPCRARRGVGLVGIHHRPDAGSVGRSSSSHFSGIAVGHLAYRAIGPGSPVANMDRLVVSRDSRCSNSHRLALQQYRQECLCCDCVPHYGEYQLAIVPYQRFVLRPAYQRTDDGSCRRSRHRRLGSTSFSPAQECATA